MVSADPLKRLDEELARWSKGVLILGSPARKADLDALEKAVGHALPATYRGVLSRFDGADLRGDHLLSVGEAREQWEMFPALLQRIYQEDPDWPDDEPPPRHLLPIAYDLEGNFKCLDLSTEGTEVVDWHRESGELTTWHRDVVGWILTCLRTLNVRFDHQGRPRPIRAGESDSLAFRELEAHVEMEPEGSYPLLELARWYADHGTPEEALFAFRRAADGEPERAVNHFYAGRWALLMGRVQESKHYFRRALVVPADPNPRKHSFRAGHLAATHNLLAMLYDLAGQTRKAEEQRRAAAKAGKRYGFQWYSQTEEYQAALRAIQRMENR